MTARPNEREATILAQRIATMNSTELRKFVRRTLSRRIAELNEEQLRDVIAQVYGEPWSAEVVN